MMRQLGACDDTTLVVTTVHESQLLDDLSSSVMTEHDLYVTNSFCIYIYSMTFFRPVNVVITPQRIIYTQNKFSCPKAINWHDIDNETMLNLPVLKEFKRLQQLQQERSK
jgi:5-formyltetrahydrofolate cyclo-ligase